MADRHRRNSYRVQDMSMAISPGASREGGWLVRFTKPPHVGLRLVCFPKTGASPTDFRNWASVVGPEVEVLAVQFPGRQRRIREEPLRTVESAVAGLAPAIGSLPPAPTVFIGDCAGAFVAYETIRALSAARAAIPSRLLVSCCRAPHVQSPHPTLHRLDDRSLVAQLAALGFVPQWLLDDQATLQDFLPILRCDLEMAECYVPAAGEPIDVAMTAFAGTGDGIAPPKDVRAWEAYTTGRFDFVLIEGAHDLVQSHLTTLLARAAGDRLPTSPTCASMFN